MMLVNGIKKVFHFEKLINLKKGLQQNQQNSLKQNKTMFGRHYDNRTHRNFVHIYSRVPYLDTQIFDIETESIKEQRRIRNRTDKATQALQRTKLKSQQLQNGLRESRMRRQEQDKSFLVDMEKSHSSFLQKEKQSWEQFTAEKSASKEAYLKDQLYLSDKLLTANTKAASRLISVRRWE